MTRARAVLVFGALTLAACAEPPVTPTALRTGGSGVASVASSGRTYVLLAEAGSALPQGLAESVQAAGGSLTSELQGIGVAVATSDNPDFASRVGQITGITDVAEDMVLQFVDPNQPVLEVEAGEYVAGDAGHQVGGHETFRLAQWGPDAVSAPAAWATGAQGAGARVAILDGGLYSLHPDIAANLDVAASASFVPGQPFNNDLGTFWHGTHVAGIVAAAANNFITVGIAPQATIIGVKVLHGGGGAFSWVINGIYYAATPIAQGGAGAHIINMSLGAQFPKNIPGGPQLLEALSRATNYAYKSGTTVIAAAGNSAVDLDHTKNLVFVPAMSVNVIAVSALGPVGWAVPGTAFNLDRPASYTNYGQSAINLSGPGGDFVLPGNALCSKPRLPSGSITTACWVFDLVMAPCRGSLPPPIFFGCWAAGTSMASPHVAGVAALIVGKYGPMNAAQVEARLRQSADDLGKPGNDDFYGRGRVNALRAVQ